MKVAIYVRVSTKDQNCELQLRDLWAYCKARNFSIFREYVDIGESGSKNSRPQLDELMAAARKRQFDTVIVWRFDRFARSVKHLLLALEEFRSLNIQFMSYQENIDTCSPLGQALFTIVAAVAQLERDLIRERVAAGLRNARAKGKRLGRPAIAINVDEILTLRADGHTTREIAEILGSAKGRCEIGSTLKRGKPVRFRARNSPTSTAPTRRFQRASMCRFSRRAYRPISF